jgi:hypothetical protein
VSDGDDKEPIGLGAIDEAVREAGDKDAAKTRPERMTALRERGQPLVCALHG